MTITMNANKALNNSIKHQKTTETADITAIHGSEQPQTNDIDLQKVKRIRKALLEGKLKIDSKQLAQKMLEMEATLFPEPDKSDK